METWFSGGGYNEKASNLTWNLLLTFKVPALSKKQALAGYGDLSRVF
jgi:hypothetical protein|tara:strand:+ start:464 stop:604 length:141 start_codon:yes stop_codon:yes gene_type:complete